MAAMVRRLDLRTVPAGKFARLRADAAAAAAGYSLARWTGPTPPEYLDSFAAVLNAYADAPHDEGYEAEAWDGDRVRERGDAIVRVIGRAPVHGGGGARRERRAGRDDAAGSLSG